MRGRHAVAVLALGALLAGGAGSGLPALAPEQAQAGHGKRCGIISKGNRDFRVFAKRMGCRKALRGARKYLRSRQALPSFTCQRNVPPYRFVCVKGAKTYRAIRL